MKVKVVVTIEARMGSTRFPGKTLARLSECTVLEYLFNRLKQSRLATDICLATPDTQSDDPIVDLAKKIKLNYFRGSERDVVSRIYGAAKFTQADVVVTTTGDCPMIDAALVDKGIKIFLNASYDCVGVGMNKSFPHGLDYYIINIDLLKDIHEKANTPYQREHTIEYVTSQPEKFKCYYLEAPLELNRPDVRITVDYPKDLEIMNKLVKRLGAKRFDYSISEIINAWDLTRRESND